MQYYITIIMLSHCAAVFQLGNARGAVTRVYVTTTGDKVYGFIPPDIGMWSHDVRRMMVL